jgi:hypothetical protein
MFHEGYSPFLPLFQSGSGNFGPQAAIPHRQTMKENQHTEWKEVGRDDYPEAPAAAHSGASN